VSESTASLTPEQAEMVARQSERWNDPCTQEGARSRLALVNVKAKANQPRLDTQLRQLAKAPAIRHKIYWLRQLAETFGDAVAPHAACTDACDGCCHQPVSVTQQEAELIARETGAQLHTPAAWSTQPVMRYAGEPCVFLKDSRCTIYQHRPMVCRLIFNLDQDALLCQMVPGSRSQAPYADHSIYKELYIRAHLGKLSSDDAMQEALKDLRMADLREFFPQGLRKPGDGESAKGVKP
jgi:Fe-S-cluster containining protein